MSGIAELSPYLVLILVGFLPNEVWRALGLVLARGLNEDSEIVLWSRAVATAIIAGPGGRREVPVEGFVTGIFSTVLEAGELLVALRIPKRSARARYGYWKFCRKAGEFAQAIGAALHDPERNETRMVMGALQGAPLLVRDLQPPPEAGEDAYSRQLHAVALKRALAQLNA